MKTGTQNTVIDNIVMEDIEQMLKTSLFDQKTQNQLVSAFDTVYGLWEKNKKLQLKFFEREIDKNLKNIQSQLQELQQNKSSGLFSYFQYDKDTQDLQSSIKIQLLELQKQVQSIYNSVDCEVGILNLGVIELNYIGAKLQFLLNHPKYQPIGFIIEFQIFESDQPNEYQMIISRKYLIQKFQQQYGKQDTHVHKLNNQNDKAFMILTYNIVEKQLALLTEHDPYIIISSANQSRIYLDKGMLLIFDNFYELKVTQTNTKNINQEQLSSSNDTLQDKFEETIKIDGYGYIQFEITNLRTRKIEFYLKNSNLDLSNHISGLQAILYHDCNGFYMIPKQNAAHYKLIYDNKLITKDSLVNVGIQLQNKFWIEVELDKAKIDCFVLD
ncbi:unnamed protein product (macronuclear) [Paramecium tetraurelia]|uniref:Uncharacterized protein n=1 Tax=Paramecium tetraurelia TaxID=5888 RepID=A0DU45_PARTE|nr:uncharacterized protein GSPATT00020233001 [Paramecium tetraurelia]CAK86562.1 unnamed protein product [Paramecium tetraurelia]|eukprot:XP_001453959.1 hypothetical protein (macronuclear) [Paramecium tetraurelia strain d4-2]